MKTAIIKEISTHKAVRNGDMIDIYELDEKIKSMPYEDIDDLVPMFDRFEETNRMNMAEFSMYFQK